MATNGNNRQLSTEEIDILAGTAGKQTITTARVMAIENGAVAGSEDLARVAVRAFLNAAKNLGYELAYAEYCAKCDHDDHRCAGCGEPIEHGRVDCDACRAEDLAFKREHPDSIAAGVRDAAEGKIKRLDEVAGTEDARPHYAADAVVFATVNDMLYVLLIRRGWPPHQGKLALPGGHVNKDENSRMACVRELAEETGLVLTPSQIRRSSIYDEPYRDPRGRYVSVAYVADLGKLNYLPALTAGDDAADVVWMPVPDVLADLDSMANALSTPPASAYRDSALLAFDHWAMVSDGLAELNGVRGAVWATKADTADPEVTEP
jgi:8-oxo-dGTP diphosphatase